MKSHEMLSFYARHFSAVEIDSTYYGLPGARAIAAFDARTPERFLFAVKAPASVTHVPDSRGRVHDDAFRLTELLEPLRVAGKLACVLAQFPNGFAVSESNEGYVRRVVEAFGAVPVVVEFRRREWQSPRGLSLLREIGAGYCNVDMPSYETLLRPSSDATSATGYVRFHGRNAKAWWKGTNVTRYEYTYSPEELMPWADRIAEIDEQAARTLVFFNNHARGQAPKNARMLDALLVDRFGAAAGAAVARTHAGTTEEALPGFGES